jgi:16S rRNA (guanine966-N2)-methyltransferase
MVLRIIAGDFKGRKLRSVHGSKTRPTANRTREAIFNILASQIPGSRVLDLFAGTGALGIEALSRMADAAVFIDNDQDAISVLQVNLASLALERQTTVIRWNPVKNLNCLKSLGIAFDLVFMDPPYLKNMIGPTLQNLHISHALAGGSRVIVEHSHREPVLAGQLPFEIADQRKYGKTLVTILEYVV